MQNDEQFIEALNNKNVSAYHTLFKDYYVSLVMYAMHYVGQEEAKDIVQDLIVSIWEKNIQFPSIGSFRTFLYTAIKNRSINYLKHKKAESNYISHALHQGSAEEQELYGIMEEEIYRIFFHVVDNLPQRCQEIFKLHLEGKKEEEIASLLQISISTVKSQKQKAFHRLKDELGELLSIIFFI